MSEVTLSKAVRSNLLSLQTTATAMWRTQIRLSTGLDVNTALDNPTNFFTAASLTSRAGDLAQLSDSVANGVQTLQAADNGLSAINKIVESMQSTLRQARQTQDFNSTDLDLTLPVHPAGSEKLTLALSGGTPPISVELTESVSIPATAATYASTWSNIDFSDVPATSGYLNFGNFSGAVTFSPGNWVDYNLNVDGASTSPYFDYNAVVATLGSPTISSPADFAAVLNYVGIAGATAVSDGAKVSIVSNSTGSSSTVSYSGGGNAGYNPPTFDPSNLVGGAIGAHPPGNNLIQRGLTFDLNIDGVVKPIAITKASVNGVGNTDNIASASELATIINGQLPAPRAAVDGNGDLRFTSTTAGGGSVVVVSNLNQIALFQSSVLAGSDVGDPATPVARTSASILDELKGHPDLINKLTVSITGNGKLRLENRTVDDVGISGDIGTKTLDASTGRSGFVEQFNTLRDQFDKLSDDASFNGINLLRGDTLSLVFNEVGTSRLNVAARNKNGDAIRTDANSFGILNVDANELNDDNAIEARLTILKTALSSLRGRASQFGSTLSMVQMRQDFTRNMTNVLKVGADNLTLADSNEEAASLLALQTRQQLSSSTLSLASQADQSVLSLLR